MTMLQRMLKSFVKIGRLTIVRPDGTKFTAGKVANDTGPDIVLRLKDRWTEFKIAINPDLYFGEAYMDGTVEIERGSLAGLLDLWGRNLEISPLRRPSLTSRATKAVLRAYQQANSRRAARRNAVHHYNLSEALFRSFLDSDMQYSCAYFREPGLSLEAAQAAKKRHIAAKLLIEPGQSILDIGSGWGGLALFLAQPTDISVLGITLSERQLAVAKERAQETGVAHKAKFELRDYRDVQGHFDRIVSVGMFEHVGVPNYRVFFDQIVRLLKPNGVAVIHAIGRMDGPGITSRWARKYIFPGGYSPALSEVLPAVERSGLWITDIEILRLHYAETLRHWRVRFLENRAQIRKAYDDRFIRMWDLWLAGSEMLFRHGGLMVFQLQLARNIDAAPIIRDYMVDRERLRMREDIPVPTDVQRSPAKAARL
ncbi:MAG: cyclopropane-fatty-acyl-phospholipid synthase family protein [Rhodomicrobium sp.]